MILRWLFRKFWEYAPRHHETIWSSANEDDGIEVIRIELARIATTLETMEEGLAKSYDKPVDVYLEMME